MTSKEALERYYSNLKYGCGGFQNDDEELEALMVIKQDLDRLEKLEKAIELLKKYVGFKLVIDPIDSIRGIEAKYDYSDISKKQYELLIEVLKL